MITATKTKTSQLSHLWKDIEELFEKMVTWRERSIYPALPQGSQIIESEESVELFQLINAEGVLEYHYFAVAN